MIFNSLIGMVTGRFGFKELAGPVGTAQAVTQAASAGLKQSFGAAVNNIVYIMLVISVNLGIVNLLPLPALDGLCSSSSKRSSAGRFRQSTNDGCTQAALHCSSA